MANRKVEREHVNMIVKYIRLNDDSSCRMWLLKASRNHSIDGLKASKADYRTSYFVVHHSSVSSFYPVLRDWKETLLGEGSFKSIPEQLQTTSFNERRDSFSSLFFFRFIVTTYGKSSTTCHSGAVHSIHLDGVCSFFPVRRVRQFH